MRAGLRVSVRGKDCENTVRPPCSLGEGQARLCHFQIPHPYPHLGPETQEKTACQTAVLEDESRSCIALWLPVVMTAPGPRQG